MALVGWAARAGVEQRHLNTDAPERASTDAGKTRSGSGQRAPRRLARGTVCATATAVMLYVVLAILFTRPLGAAPWRWGIWNEDTQAFVWELTFLARQMIRDPLHLLNGNIYWPYSLTVLYNDLLVVQAVRVAPIVWLGGSPYLAHNLSELLSFPLAGLGAFLLASDFVRSRLAAVFAGMVYAFSAFRLAALVHINVLSTEWLPFVVLFILRASRRQPPRGTFVGLFAAVALQGLSSGYYAILTLVVVALACAWHARRLLSGGRWRRVALAVGGASVLLALAAVPYGIVRQREQIHRSQQDAVRFSARPAGYLHPAGAGLLPHVRWLRSAVEPSASGFQGIVTLALALWGAFRVRRRRGFFLASTGLMFLLSLGPEIRLGEARIPGPYELLRLVPFADMMRCPGRFAAYVTLGIAVLAALGLDRIIRRLQWNRHLASGVAVAALLVTALELDPGRASVVVVPTPPAWVAWLASAPRGPVLELPADASRLGEQGQYMYWSLFHRQPLANGYGTYSSKHHIELGLLGKRFPEESVVRIFRGVGIRYVVVHPDRLRSQRAQQLRRRALPEGLSRLPSSDSTWIYAISPEGDRVVPDYLRAFAPIPAR
jgi:hypothetical protein